MRAIGVPVYLLPGNHDPLDASSVYTSALFTAECPDNVVGPRPRRASGTSGRVCNSSPRRGAPRRRPPIWSAAVLTDLPADGTTRIVVAHGGVDILDPDPTKPSLIRLAGLSEALDRGAVHYVALGDKHSRTRVGDSGRIWYSGSPEVTNYDHVEADPGHVLVVDVDESDPAHPVSVESHHVGRWRFLTLHRQVDNSRDIADLDVNLDLLPDKDRTVVQLGLTGTLTVTDRAALDACLDKYARLFAASGHLGPAHRHRGDAGRRRVRRSRHRRVRRRRGRRTGRHRPIGRRRTPRTPRARWRCCCGWPAGARHETAPAAADQLSRNRPPRDRVSRPRRGRRVRRQRDRQVLDDRGARPAAGVQGPLDQEGRQAGQAHPRRCRLARSWPRSAPALTVSCTASASTRSPRPS